MASFESGVSSFVTGTCEIAVHFPVDEKGRSDISCFRCKFYSRSGGVCRINNEVPAYPERFVGQFCPLEIKED